MPKFLGIGYTRWYLSPYGAWAPSAWAPIFYQTCPTIKMLYMRLLEFILLCILSFSVLVLLSMNYQHFNSLTLKTRVTFASEII